MLSGNLRTVRVVVPQPVADLVRRHTQEILVRLADRAETVLRARSAREVPGGSERLPSRVLALEGGGPFATVSHDADGLKTLERTFQFDLELDGPVPELRFGTRAYVRFAHAPQALWVQVWRNIRQLFLARLAV